MLNKLELAKLDGEKITLNKLEEIEENENIIELENLGMSGLHDGYIWYCAIIEDKNGQNFEIDLYVKF